MAKVIMIKEEAKLHQKNIARVVCNQENLQSKLTTFASISITKSDFIE